MKIPEGYRQLDYTYANKLWRRDGDKFYHSIRVTPFITSMITVYRFNYSLEGENIKIKEHENK